MDEGSFAPLITTPKSKTPIIMAAVIIAIVAIVVFAIFGKFGQPKFDAAEYMPSDVAMAVTIDLDKLYR